MNTILSDSPILEGKLKKMPDDFNILNNIILLNFEHGDQDFMYLSYTIFINNKEVYKFDDTFIFNDKKDFTLSHIDNNKYRDIIDFSIDKSLDNNDKETFKKLTK